MTKRAVITGVGHYLPKRIVPNSEFEKTLNTSDDWIITRSGIRRRHFSNEDETTSKMAVLAGKQAIEDAISGEKEPKKPAKKKRARKTGYTSFSQ